MFDRNDKVMIRAVRETFLPHSWLNTEDMAILDLDELLKNTFHHIDPLNLKDWQWTEDGWHIHYSFKEPLL